MKTYLHKATINLPAIVASALFMMVSPGVAKAQLLNLPNDSAVWSMRSSFLLQDPWENRFTIDFLHMTGDTVLNGKEYAKLVWNNNPFFDRNDPSYRDPYAYLREDAGGAIYIRRTDTAEYILFNFNLKVGDTFVVSNFFTVGGCQFVAASIDTVMAFGKMRRLITFNESSSHLCWAKQHFWMEGVGDIVNGLLYMLLPPFDWEYSLFCFWERKQYLKDDGCIFLSTKTIEKDFSYKAFPNPFINTVQLNLQAAPTQVQLFAAGGQKLITEFSFGNGVLILSNLDRLPQGLYLLMITLPDGTTLNCKLYKQQNL